MLATVDNGIPTVTPPSRHFLNPRKIEQLREALQ
jgi:hypothetical protein